jgi:hypothetical protein
MWCAGRTAPPSTVVQEALEQGAAEKAAEVFRALKELAHELGGTLESTARALRFTESHDEEDNGAVKYDGLQSPVTPELTVWGITMYGGVALSGGTSRDGGPIQTSSRWIAITGPGEVAATIDRLK